MAVLVCGGAGYIGSHAVIELLKNNKDVLVADNLENGYEAAISKDAQFIKGDLRNQDFLMKLFKENCIEGVMHFAAYSLVGESMGAPYEYYNNNVGGTINLLNAMRKHNVNKIVFSSTAAVYGDPQNIPILEGDRTSPKNPYGETKLSVEKALKWFDSAYGIKYTALRYFNVAGADADGKIGEAHKNETHLIPIVLKAALGRRDSISIFGDDYNTEDGTCIRDYIHVTDLCEAHVLALNKLMSGGQSAIYNLGNGDGFSVLQVIETAKRVTGKNIKAVVEKRREGDPSVLIASSDRISSELGFKPKNGALETIIQSAYRWHFNNPCGYERM